MTTLSPPRTFASQLHDLVLAPSRQIPEAETRDAKLVTSLALVIIVALAMRLFAGLDALILAGLIAGIIAYAISRTPHRKIAGVIIIAVLVVPSLSGLATLTPTAGTNIADWVVARLAWVALPLLLASIFFSWRGTLATGVLIGIAAAMISTLNPDLTMRNMTGSIALIGVLTALLVLAVRHRNQVENDRKAQLLRINHELTDARDNLEKRVTDRTVELNQALAKAERSDQVKSAFLASMSHELRTPLNSIINFTKFVNKGVMGPVNERQTDTLTKVINSGKHLLNLINDVLDMSKIESGSMHLFIEDNLNPGEIIQSAVASGQSLLEDKPVSLELTLAEDLPLMTGDRQRLYQVMLNIISNACKFTETGHILVRAQHQQGEVLISIADTGPGIAAEDADAVFEAFKQTRTGVRQGSGTGLGMPISKNLVEAHGGKLWFESVVDQGTTFHISLPVKTAVPVAVEA
ncbi:MAG: hypothetical protein H7X77_09125 [Anaerolineae bacterium]|nr:hypothetical protein [Anaerolineae bacterium]